MAAVEFAIVGPIFLLLLFAILGVGLDAFYQLTLDDAVRDAARQLQIDGPAAVSGTGFATAVCEEFSILAPNCTANVSYSVQAGASTINPFASITPAVLSNTGQFPGNSGNSKSFLGAYADNVSVLVQVAYPLPFSLPFIGALITNTGTGSIVTTTTVRTEPF